jgi:paraquat-inducible protein B
LAREGDALVLPSEGGGLDGITSAIADVAAKVDKIPFEKIGQNASGALASMQKLADNIDANAEPALAELPGLAQQLSELAKNANGALGPNGYGASSEFQRTMERLMSQVNDAARSYRALADYLDRHPEALIRGRGAQAER